jgi:hypothetical protein
MAEAFVNYLCCGAMCAESASIVRTKTDPLAVLAMSELGIPIRLKEMQSVLDVVRAECVYNYVVTISSKQVAETFPVLSGGTQHLHWSLDDPLAVSNTMEERIANTRAIRDEILAKIEAWCGEVCRDNRDEGCCSKAMQ